MSEKRRCPIQGEYGRRMPMANGSSPVRSFLPTDVDWRLAELAYSEYVNHGGRGQSLERLAERGGFGIEELVLFLLGAMGWEVTFSSATAPKEHRPPWKRDLNPEVFGDE